MAVLMMVRVMMGFRQQVASLVVLADRQQVMMVRRAVPSLQCCRQGLQGASAVRVDPSPATLGNPPLVRMAKMVTAAPVVAAVVVAQVMLAIAAAVAGLAAQVAVPALAALALKAVQAALQCCSQALRLIYRTHS